MQSRMQGAAEDTTIALLKLLAHIYEAHRRQRQGAGEGQAVCADLAANPFVQFKQGVVPLLGGGVAFDGGRGTAQQHHAPSLAGKLQSDLAGMVARLIVLLETRFVFFVEDNQAQVGQGRKHGRTAADQQAGFTAAQLPPRIVAFADAEVAVEHRHLARQASNKATHQLGREGNFGNQHKGLAAEPQRTGDCPQVDFSFAAASYAMQQKRARRVWRARATGPAVARR